MDRKLDHYKLLGIDINANHDAIKKAYFKKALQWHPDKHGGDIDAERMFKEIKRAYETLSNDVTKIEYDAQREDDTDNDIINADLFHLTDDKRPSQLYEEKIAYWMSEYDTLIFFDNFDAEMASITKKIVDKYQEDITEHTSVVICSVCNEQCENLREHFQINCNMYWETLEKINRSNPSLNEQLAQITGEHWSWKPIDIPLRMYQEIWLSEKWLDVQLITTELSPALSNLKEEKPNPSIFDAGILKKTELLLNSHIMNYIPDIKHLVLIVDKENNAAPSEQTRTMTEDLSQRVATGTRISIAGSSDASTSLSEIYYTVTTPPSPQDGVTTSKCCSVCDKSLSLDQNVSCRMCGKALCSGCQKWETCRHLGYTQAVRICHVCSLLKANFLVEAIFTHIIGSLTSNHNENLSKHIALLMHYSPYNNTISVIEDRFWEIHDFDGIMLCFTYRNAGKDSWMSLAEITCSCEKFCQTVTCLNMITKNFYHSAQEWIQTGDQYAANNNSQLALLCYREAELNYEQILLKSLKTQDPLLILYALRQAQQLNTANKYLKFLMNHLIDKSDHELVLSALHLVNIKTSEWVLLLDDAAARRQFTAVTKILRSMPTDQVREILSEAKNLFVQVICNILTTPNERLQSRLLDTEMNMEKQILNLVVLNIYQPPNWDALQNAFFIRRELDRVLICYKFRSLLNISTDNLNWIETLLSENDPLGYYMKSFTTTASYIQLAEAYSAEGNQFETALNFYMLQLNESLTAANALSILESSNNCLPSSQELRCQLAVYKLMKHDVVILPNILEAIITNLQKEGKPITDIVIACILHLREKNVDKPLFHQKYLKELQKQLHKNIVTINAGLHLFNIQNMYLKGLIDLYSGLLSDECYVQLETLIYGTIGELANYLSQSKNVIAMERISQAFFGNRNVKGARGDYHCKMLLLEGSILKLKGQFVNAVEKFYQCMIYWPFEETAEALTTIMSDPDLQNSLLYEFLTSIPLLSQSVSGTPFKSSIHPPPVAFATVNHLSPSTALNFLKRYERAILRRLDIDSFQVAMSYIDMCQAVNSPTAIVSNLTLACLHLFNLMVKAKNNENNNCHLYAYWKVVEELAVQILAFSQNYLTPHMQIYTYRRLLNVLVDGNKILQDVVKSRTMERFGASSSRISPLISDRQSELIKVLLNLTMHLTKVSPLVQMHTSLTYDAIYLDAVGQKCLQSFLENMSEESSLHQYYLFEGVWNGWVRNENFTEMRLKCMEALLANRDWNLYDVQLLLDVPLIPRSTDGWLDPKYSPLAFASQQQFAKVDGISFNTVSGEIQFQFQPSDGRNQLFDSNDVVEVFQRGLTSCIFTLNQPNNDLHAHPFQEMLYMPSTLQYTQYLATLLHTDYLLKMFTTGTEVAAKPPFEMRAAANGFFNRLPVHLQEKLKPLHDRERGFSFGRAHRFWIEAGEVVYKQEHSGDQLIFRVAGASLKVRKHLLVRDINGELIDDEEANETEEEKSSAESQFAKAFSDHYDEIGSYFPELLRLKELLKLSALYVFAKHRYEQLQERVLSSSIVTNLNNLRSQITYPVNTSVNIEKYYLQVLSDNGISASNVSANQASDIRTKIAAQLAEADMKTIDNLVKNICEQAYTASSATATSLVKAWLDGNASSTEQLAQFIANGLTAHNHALQHPIERLGLRLIDDPSTYQSLRHNDESCNWVPAVFLNKTGSSMRIYGGVSLNLKLKEEQVPINNLLISYNASNIFGNISHISVTGPRSKEEAQIMKDNFATWKLIKDFQPSSSIGSLSAKYESGRRGPGTINAYKKLGKGDPGGASYGTYQIATGTGTMKNFMKWMGANHQDMASRFDRLTPGTESFDKAWKELAADKDEFRSAQHEFIKNTHYDKTLSLLPSTYRDQLNLDGRSPVIKDVIWSTSVQHGASGGARIIRRVLEGQNNKNLSDEELINRIYSERGADDGHKYFRHSSEEVRQGRSNVCEPKTYLFSTVKYGNNYGPRYVGSESVASSVHWNILIREGKATQYIKTVVTEVLRNEGKLDSVQAYDNQTLTAGTMQMTIRKDGQGELPKQVYEFKQEHPELYKKHFENAGWTVNKNGNGNVIMSYKGLTGTELYNRIHENKFSSRTKEQQTSEPLGSLVCAIRTPEYQKKQLLDSIQRREVALDIKPKDSEYKVKDYLKTQLGEATVLDQHINRPGYVKEDFGKALNHFFSKNLDVSRNPADWPADRRQLYEQEILDYYGHNRRMTDADKRYNRLKQNLSKK